MNRTPVFRRLTLLAFALIVGGWVIAGTAAAFDQTSMAFYEKHPMTADEVKSKMGKPTKTVKAHGVEKLYYKIQHNFLVDTAYRFYVIKDGKVLYSGLSQTIEGGKEIKKAEQFPISRLDQAYYQKNMVSVDKLEKVMGKPMLIKPSTGGTNVYVYKMKAPWIVDSSYQYFIVKNGRVMGSGATDVVIKEDVKDEGKVKPQYVKELSKIFYEKHHLSVAEVDKVWGTPLVVKKLSDTVEERFYSNKEGTQTILKYRYFVVENGQVIASGVADSVD